jgi:DNA-binding transcriptional MerR regulator
VTQVAMSQPIWMPAIMSIALSLHSAFPKVSEAADADIGISEMSRLFGTTLRTLRFYEARGLLKPRREGQNRYYDAVQQQRFRLIDEGRNLGFTLTEIARMLGSDDSVDRLNLTLDAIQDQIEHLEEQHKQIDQALADLRRRYYVMSAS